MRSPNPVQASNAKCEKFDEGFSLIILATTWSEQPLILSIFSYNCNYMKIYKYKYLKLLDFTK
jgi:hypothetical protein